MKFLAVRQVSLMTHRQCCVDRAFLYHVTGVGWEPSPTPPPRYTHWVAYINWLLALNPQYPEMLSHLLVISLTGSHSSSSSLTLTSPICKHHPDKEWVALSYLWCFSLASFFLPFILLGLELLSSSLLWVHLVVQFGPMRAGGWRLRGRLPSGDPYAATASTTAVWTSSLVPDSEGRTPRQPPPLLSTAWWRYEF
jgi:hypothetical protein